MSFLRNSRTLPRHTAMQISPWLLVGSALILGLAITFWAIKNATLERENMSRNLQERAGGLMWAMEGGARVGIGMRNAVPYLQQMLEETARQPGIAYMAVIREGGEVVAHSDKSRIGMALYPAEGMEGLFPDAQMHWRVVKKKGQGSVFEAFKTFSPLRGISSEHMPHGRMHGMGHMRMMRGMGRGGLFRGLEQPPQEAAPAPPFRPGGQAFVPPVPPDASGEETFADGAPLRRRAFPSPGGEEYLIVIGLDMAPLENALTAGQRSIAFTAFLVGMLGVGGFISMFWAQSYKFSRRLLLDASAITDKVITSLPLGLIILDASGKVTEANGVAESLLDYPPKGLLGLKPEGMAGMDWSGIARRVRQGGQVLEEEHTLLLPPQNNDGESRAVPMSVSASRILNDEGESLGMFYLLRDLREVKRLQEELRRSERLSTLGNMAARVAHEIRNPLSSIKGFATYLGSRHTGDADAEAARTMIGEVDRLNRVVSELLDFARPANLNIAPADMRAVLERAMRLVDMDAAAKGVRLSLDAPAGEASGPLFAAVDAERVTQAVLNLLINAVQATDKDGSVTVGLTREGDKVRVSIADTGRGMPPEVIAQIFNPYFTTKTLGTGLGLSIVSKIVEDHNGEIKVCSEVGQGTTILLRLPGVETVPPDHSGDANG